MNTAIIDLQTILTDYPESHIITLAEIKHRHIKSMWRQSFKDFELVKDPSLYIKHIKRCSGVTILAIHKTALTRIELLQVPPQHHPYHVIALITPKSGSEIFAIIAYLPQHYTIQGHQTYEDILIRLKTLLTVEYPHMHVLLVGDMQATSSPHHDSHYKSLSDFLTDTSLLQIGDPLIPTFITTNSALDR
jgi:hypothetical protein